MRKAEGIRTGLLAIAVAAVATLPVGARGQSINLDLDIFGGPPEIGNGQPSPSFGAAANQPGAWNRISAGGPTVPAALFGLAGQATGVTLLANGGTGTATGFNNAANTGDHALLLNDGAQIDPALDFITYNFTGLQSGRYTVYTYAVSPIPNDVVITEVVVPGSLPPSSAFVLGPMPGNSFAEGITHSIHTIDVSNGELRIDVINRDPSRNSYVNGFQLTLVPEPVSSVALLVGLSALAMRGRKIGRTHPRPKKRA